MKCKYANAVFDVISPWKDDIIYITDGCAEFLDSKLILLSESVRSISEFGSVVWNPSRADKTEKLEKLYKYLQCSYYTLVWGVKLALYRYAPPPPRILQTEFVGWLTIISRRKHFDVLLFVYKLINGVIDCPDFSSPIHYRVPAAFDSIEINK